MHRRLVPLVLVLTFLALGAWSGSAGAIVVCPQTGTCCGPPTPAHDAAAPCCTTTCCGSSTCCAAGDVEPACPATRLTISTSPDPSVAGQSVTISGRLTGGASGTSVSLWQKLAGQSSFRNVAQTTTNASGDYTFARGAGTVQKDTSWYTTASGARSATQLQRVSAQVKLVTWTVAGGLVKLHGHVAPSHRGEAIALQRHTAKGWRTIARTVIGRLSRFTLLHRFAHKGNVQLRALFGGDSSNTRSASAPLRLLVS